MALFFERMRLCAQKVLDTTDIVRDAMFHHLLIGSVFRPISVWAVDFQHQR